ncbi:type II toxin-antitoxin system PemK/MazF family toxin [Pedobacter sp. Du54]|uniref:type II toxin-antitoxin system PemK/MazF family toxin n=1 Tax=Pedobacter anseongensis TaxID=3133439 RepID=UPI0030ABA7E1
MVVNRFEVYFVQLDPTIGNEISKVRPCVIVSAKELNRSLNTVMVAPLTSTLRNYPTRINCFVDGKSGQVALDQVRTIDKKRLSRKIALLDPSTGKRIIENLIEMFS